MEYLENIPAWVSSLIAIFGGILGLIGAILGIINFIISIVEKRVNLKVIPNLAFVDHQGVLHARKFNKEYLDRVLLAKGIPTIGIEIINLSKFAVTIDEIGFCNGNPNKGERLSIILPNNGTHNSLPHKLESRMSFTVYAYNTNILDIPVNSFKYVYATTSCNEYKLVKPKDFFKGYNYITSIF